MQFPATLNPDRPTPALVGNGRLVTYLGASGYHDEAADGAPSMQEFVLAGRRGPGPAFPLISFGRLTRAILVDAEEVEPREADQVLETENASLASRLLRDGVLESTRSLVLAHRNTFLVETRLTNNSDAEVGVVLRVRYALEEQPGVRFAVNRLGAGAEVGFEAGDNLGLIHLTTPDSEWQSEGDSALALTVSENLRPGQTLRLRVALTFSDRIEFAEPFDWSRREAAQNDHERWWREFWATSDLVTGIAEVDQTRNIALYAIACQATPWSIPPVLCREPWHGGAFHDELYPFLALLSAGHERLARRIPHFRLACLPRAVERGRGLGALYPWNSTEQGLERDPVGQWYTERHHLGAIAATAWFSFLYSKNPEVLEDIYPLLRECARAVEEFVLTTDARGKLISAPCTDFDESAPPIAAGPFTMAAAAFVLSRAAEAAARLHRDLERAARWEDQARELQTNFPVDVETRRYAMPTGAPEHIAVAGYVAPFFVDDGSPYARNAVARLHADLQTEFGWKPGHSSVFEGTAWMWTAGHLAMCHAVLGNGHEALEAVVHGVSSTGRFLSPNEHLRADGSVAVPWFTTGAGAWLTGLHWMFARCDDNGDHLLDAVPESLQEFHFHGLRLSRGVSAAARVSGGCLQYLSLSSPVRQAFTFEIPTRFAEGTCLPKLGRVIDLETHWRVQVDLLEGPNDLATPS
ncbi:MAG: hypothetical protein AB1725_01690 [Armatimonadota bacterium]